MKNLSLILATLTLASTTAFAALPWSNATKSGEFSDNSTWDNGVPDISKKLEISSGHTVGITDGSNHTIGTDGGAPVANNTKINNGTLDLQKGQINFSRRIHAYGGGSIIIGDGSNGDNNAAVFNGTSIVFGSNGSRGSNGTAAGNATLELRKGGSLQLSSQLVMGNNIGGTSTYKQSGGTAFADALTVGNDTASGLSTLSISSGRLLTTKNAIFSKAERTDTLLDIKGDGKLYAHTFITLSNGSNSNSTINLSDNGSMAALTGNIDISHGSQSNSTLNISGNASLATTTTNISFSGGSAKTVINLSESGSLNVGRSLYAGKGEYSNVIINMSGGSFFVRNAIALANNKSATANLTLSDGRFDVGTGNFANGTDSTLSINMSGGSFSVNTTGNFASAENSQVNIDMADGRFFIGTTGNFANATGSNASLSIGGGNFVVGNAIQLGNNTGTNVKFDMSGGHFNVAGGNFANGTNSKLEFTLSGDANFTSTAMISVAARHQGANATLVIKGNASFTATVFTLGNKAQANSSANLALRDNARIILESSNNNADLRLGGASAGAGSASISATFSGNSAVISRFDPKGNLSSTGHLSLRGSATSATLSEQAQIDVYGIRMRESSRLVFLVKDENFSASINLNGGADLNSELGIPLGILDINPDASIIIDLSKFSPEHEGSGRLEQNLITNIHFATQEEIEANNTLFLISANNADSILHIIAEGAIGIQGRPALAWRVNENGLHDLVLSFEYSTSE